MLPCSLRAEPPPPLICLEKAARGPAAIPAAWRLTVAPSVFDPRSSAALRATTALLVVRESGASVYFFRPRGSRYFFRPRGSRPFSRLFSTFSLLPFDASPGGISSIGATRHGPLPAELASHRS